ncbi:hypothetical protein I0C86_41215 [Plantactinospora sp. S1510]|uniref:Uncharacterized protein n=1 Tax=Plantactinospora alkalitolerans TaxID=2789879 RepID=A0ABS0H9W2_9ACTN|nr:hypothetical protein [Plantactinospora alkalitolerans]MBF9135273.1 hypothetical protein [Plantactinospora alkalitolerans]
MESDDALVALLPALPYSYVGSGYDWMGGLAGGWYAVGVWGSDGWDLGNWPYVIVAHYDDGVYGRVLYCEGDLTIEAYPEVDARDKATSDTAVFYWRHYGHGPKDLPAEGEAPLYGPCTC